MRTADLWRRKQPLCQLSHSPGNLNCSKQHCFDGYNKSFFTHLVSAQQKVLISSWLSLLKQQHYLFSISKTKHYRAENRKLARLKLNLWPLCSSFGIKISGEILYLFKLRQNFHVISWHFKLVKRLSSAGLEIIFWRRNRQKTCLTSFSSFDMSKGRGIIQKVHHRDVRSSLGIYRRSFT